MNSLKTRIRDSIDDFRRRLAYYDALPQLVSLGVLSGIAASLLIVAFRWLIESPLMFIFSGDSDGFESLPLIARFLLPFFGALLIGVILRSVKPEFYSVSVSHVLERLHNHQGKLPKENILVQFLGGIVSLVSGQSVGREGPGIHLGAGVASLMGQWFRLPNNSLRTLVACGSAAAIAASFNTPMAGVIFAMEVILMEYTIIGFIPVIIASVLGALISQLFFETDINFVLTGEQLNILWEMPFMIFAGLVFSVAAAAFIKLHLAFFNLHSYSIMLRFTAIGLVTGAVAIFVPQIMGTGYDTLNAAMLGEMGVLLLLLIVVAKLSVTAMATGLGMLGGLIGPTLVIGGCLGGLLGILGNTLVPTASNPDFYVILGMVAMMGAVLNAPLAAMVAILELSNSPGIIFPSMLTVVVACLAVRQIFHYEGIFAEQLKLQGHDLFAEPGRGFLSRVGVQSVMNSSFAECDQTIDVEVATSLVANNAMWLVITQESGTRLLATTDLARYLDSQTDKKLPLQELDLALIDAKLFNLDSVDSLANLHEASTLLRGGSAEALLVIESTAKLEARVVGIISKETIMNYYGM